MGERVMHSYILCTFLVLFFLSHLGAFKRVCESAVFFGAVLSTISWVEPFYNRHILLTQSHSLTKRKCVYAYACLLAGQLTIELICSHPKSLRTGDDVILDAHSHSHSYSSIHTEFFFQLSHSTAQQISYDCSKPPIANNLTLF